jgi:integrase/recombinase XerD
VQVQRDDAGTLRQFLDFLRCQRVILAEKIPPPRLTAIEQAVQEFERYLHDERTLAEVTVKDYVPFVREFLANRFGDGPVRLSRLRAGDVVRFVQCQAPRLHVKRT